MWEWKKRSQISDMLCLSNCTCILINDRPFNVLACCLMCPNKAICLCLLIFPPTLSTVSVFFISVSFYLSCLFPLFSVRLLCYTMCVCCFSTGIDSYFGQGMYGEWLSLNHIPFLCITFSDCYINGNSKGMKNGIFCSLNIWKIPANIIRMWFSLPFIFWMNKRKRNIWTLLPLAIFPSVCFPALRLHFFSIRFNKICTTIQCIYTQRLRFSNATRSILLSVLLFRFLPFSLCCSAQSWMSV